MDTRPNEWRKLNFVDPAIVLPKLRIIQLQVANSILPDRVKNLRTPQLKQHREGWEAALFCYGKAKLQGVPVYVVPYESSDYDAVAMWIKDNTQHFAPIQIKEVVHEELNPNTDINKEIAKLNRYPVSNDTAVVIHVNRQMRLDLSLIKVPKLNIASLWLLGANAPDQSKWFVAGDLLNSPQIIVFDYPCA